MALLKRNGNEKMIFSKNMFEENSQLCQAADSMNRFSALTAPKLVAPMVAAFNRQKRAFASANTSYRKTGSLDLSRIASYKTSDDIFISKATQAVGQSHAVYLLIDTSGSMRSVMGQVAMQYYITVLFLKRANIPFVVTTFTTAGSVASDVPADGEFLLGHVPLLREIANDKMTVSELQDVFNNLSMLVFVPHLRAASVEGKRYAAFLATQYSMSGTPLVEAMTYTYAECVKLKSSRQVDNVTLLLISDGLGSHIRVMNNGRAWSPSAVTCPFTGRTFTSKSGAEYNCRFISTINEMMNSQGISTQCVFIHDGISSVRTFIRGMSSVWVNEKEVIRNGNCEGMAGFKNVFFIGKNEYPTITGDSELVSGDADEQTARQIAKSILVASTRSARLKSMCDIFVAEVTKSSKKLKKVV